MGMKMAKASQADLKMALELAGALDAISQQFGPSMPERIAMPTRHGIERFDGDDSGQCVRVVRYFLELATSASLSRVVHGMVVLLDPENGTVDPDADTLEHHPDRITLERARVARPLAEWTEEDGAVLWWRLPVEEAPYSGHPNCNDWPGYHTHWTPLVLPVFPTEEDATG